MLALYPLIPWIGVMAAGYVFGRLYTLDAGDGVAALIRLGVGIVALFVVLRATNLYGDPSKWSVQQERRVHRAVVPEHDEVSAVAAVPLHDDRTGDPAAGVPGARPARRDRARRWSRTAACRCCSTCCSGCTRTAWRSSPGLDRGHEHRRAATSCRTTRPRYSQHVGFSLPVVYAFWILGVLLLYPICARYAAVKARTEGVVVGVPLVELPLQVLQYDDVRSTETRRDAHTNAWRHPSRRWTRYSKYLGTWYEVRRDHLDS